MTVGVVLLNFGEPEEPTRERVLDYLERIFLSNMSLEGEMDAEAARERARSLAERRAPGLLEEYDAMGGGSPLIPQARAQAAMLEDALAARGHDVATAVGMQYTEPFVDEAVAAVADEGAERLVGLPVYPLCGKTTTVESLEMFEAAAERLDDPVPTDAVSGWHGQPGYAALRGDNLAAYLDDAGVDPAADDVATVFSAHGTPLTYIEEDGIRYDDYVEEHCAAVAEQAGVEEYHIGYQNHQNRDVAWTEPETEDLVEELAPDHDAVVVEPISFLHEQSETLSELDVELREECDDLGLALHRVPVPHDHPDLGGVLADVVEPLVVGDAAAAGYVQCECRGVPGTVCLNAD